MTKFRNMFEKIFKESVVLKEYDSRHFSFGSNDGDVLKPHDSLTYIKLKVLLDGHKALLDKLHELGYTKENDYDPVVFENGEAYISIDDAAVYYHIDVENGEEYVDKINSVAVYDFIADKAGIEADITGALLPEDLENIKRDFNNGGVELESEGLDIDELRSDYYHSIL